jgi:hypothetical protein
MQRSKRFRRTPLDWCSEFEVLAAVCRAGLLARLINCMNSFHPARALAQMTVPNASTWLDDADSPVGPVRTAICAACRAA